MERIEEKVTLVSYRSSVHPEIETRKFRADEDGLGVAKLIAWADENPVAWDIVMGTKSAAWGRSSSRYMGCERGADAGSVLSRLRTFEYELNRPGADSVLMWSAIFRWSARFTMAHYRDKGFRGGLFQRFDGRYDRDAIVLDYTPETLDEAISKFLEWAGDTFTDTFTASVKVDGKVVLDEAISKFLELVGDTFVTASVKVDDKVVREFCSKKTEKKS